ncbi:unnamed protein product [Nyctereutes procyonoides]|uniref:non-specific serine/threonine protein kinase n=1 Tax=Nyctereutes procyonoides TaxID=34880 RepID=A0A811YZU6_NYCPR|nr:unnamed protein product [Nyctereutes procyonoides]
MQYCDGGDLMRRMHRQQGVLFILSWFVQISLGLKYIHDRKHITGNFFFFFFFFSKNGMVAKLVDFGIARCSPSGGAHCPEKHPGLFESNNLHQLVLKLCQGQFAPISPRFAHDPQALVSQLFEPKIQKARFQGKCLPRSRLAAPIKRKEMLCRNEWRPPAEPRSLYLYIKIVQRPKLAAVHGHYDYYYAQLDMLRRRAHEPSYCWVPQEDPGVEGNYNQEESHTVHHQVNAEHFYFLRPAEYLQGKSKGLCPSYAESDHNQRQKLRSNGEESRCQELQIRRNKTKNRLETYHNDMKEIKKKMRRQLLYTRTRLVAESKFLPIRGVKLEIGLNQCTSDENTLQEEEWVCKMKTLTFEDGMKLKEYKCVKEYEDYTDKAFEELCCPEAELFIQDTGAAAGNGRQWDVRAPQTAGDDGCGNTVSSSGGRGIVTEGVPENRRRWRQEAPGTLMSTLAAAHLTSSSFSASEGELVGTLKQWLPKEDEGNVEMAFGIEVDKEQPRYDDDDDDDDDTNENIRKNPIYQEQEDLIINQTELPEVKKNLVEINIQMTV